MTTTGDASRPPASIGTAQPQPLHAVAVDESQGDGHGLVLQIHATPQVDLGAHLQQLLQTTARQWRIKPRKLQAKARTTLASRYLTGRQHSRLSLAPVWFAY